MLRVIPVPCRADNYAYLIVAGTACAIVDPSDAAPVEAALAREGLRPTHILNTHHHNDHVGGNLDLKARHGLTVVGPAREAERIPGMDVGVTGKAGWHFAGRDMAVLEVPGHTLGAVTYVIDGHAFTGDTLFTMGCGRLFEGDAEMMWASLTRLMTLPGDTKIWCGHEYAQSNGRFALSVEPDNAELKARVAAMPPVSVPSTMALEKATNPFLRAGSARRFGELRAAKDRF